MIILKTAYFYVTTDPGTLPIPGLMGPQNGPGSQIPVLEPIVIDLYWRLTRDNILSFEESFIMFYISQYKKHMLKKYTSEQAAPLVLDVETD